MKKVKTVILSLIVMLASAFISACSCGGGDGTVQKVYAQSLSVKCLVDDDYADIVRSEYDEVSKQLDIYCHVDARFIIEYTIAPSDTTETEVRWTISDGENLIKPYREDYIRKGATTEKVEFVAIGTSQLDNQTTITFSTGSPNIREAICNVTVYDRKENLPTLVKPNFDRKGLVSEAITDRSGNVLGYNNIIEWNEITEVYPKNSTDKVPASMENGAVKGLDHYKVTIAEKGGETVEYKVDRKITQYPTDAMLKGEEDYTPLEDGKEYSIQVTAIGNGGDAMSGEISDPYKFIRVPALTGDGMTHKDGVVTFKSPKLAYSYKLYYADREAISGGTSPEITQAVGYQTFDPLREQDAYDFSVVFYPEGCSVNDSYYQTDDFVRHFPSNRSKVLSVQLLKSPEIAFTSTRGDIIIDGVTFTSPDLNARPETSSRLSWSLPEDVNYVGYGVKYKYELLCKTVNDSEYKKVEEKETEETSISMVGRPVGAYKINVQTIGNENTLPSQTVSADFNILPQLGGDHSTVTLLANDFLKIETDLNAGSIDLYFVYQSNNATDKQNKSKFVNLQNMRMSSVDLGLEGLEPGSYKIYGKCNGYFAGIPNLVSIPTTGLHPIISGNINVLAPTSNMSIAGDGNIYWKQVDGNTDYRILINSRKSGTSEEGQSISVDVTNTGNDLNKYAQKDNELYINVRDVIDYFLSNTANLDGVTTNAILHVDNTLSCKIVTIGKDESNISSSTANMRPLEFVKQVFTSDYADVKLLDYVLSFNCALDEVGNPDESADYKLTIVKKDIDEKEVVIAEKEIRKIDAAYTVESSRVQINLTNFPDLLNAIEEGQENIVHIQTLGTPGNSTLGVSGRLDSDEITYSIFTTNKPINLAITEVAGAENDSYFLKWQAGEEHTEQGYSYKIDFYKFDSEKSEFVLCTDDTLTNQQITSDGVEIGTILAKYPDTLIAIEISERNSAMINGSISDRIYATRITSPVLRYEQEGEEYSIAWNDIPNAQGYDVVVLDAEGQQVELEENTSLTKYPFVLNGKNAGKYTVSVSALGNKTADAGTKEKPYVINSVSSSKDIFVVSKSIKPSIGADGDSIEWDSITTIAGNDQIKATYNVICESQNETKTIDNGQNTTFSMKDIDSEGLSITIEPSINFADVVIKEEGKEDVVVPATGFILIGTLSTISDISKLPQPVNLRTVNGELIFDVHGLTSTENVIVELYSVGETYIKQNSSLFSFSSEEITKQNSSQDTEDTPATIEEDDEEGETTTPTVTYVEYKIVLDGIKEGDLSLAVRLKHSEKTMLSSKYSETINGTKIGTPTDVEKVGGFLLWKPVNGADQYEITFTDKEGSSQIKKVQVTPVLDENDLIVDYTTKYITVETIEDVTTEVAYDNADIFDYDKTLGVFKYAFDEKVFVGSATGDIVFKIRAVTTSPGYFNGNSSSEYSITKLGGATISVVNGMIYVADYDTDTFSATKPLQYQAKLYKTTANNPQTGSGTDGEDDQTSTPASDPEASPTLDEEVWDSKKQTYTSIDPIDLNVISGNKLAEGSYYLTIEFFGNGDNILDSTITKSGTFTKLPTTILSTTVGKIQWNAVTDATSYTFEINGKNWILNDAKDINILDESLLVEEQVKTDVDENQPEPTADDSNNGFTFVPGTLYEVRIKANKEGLLHSQWSTILYTKKLVAPDTITISRNTALRENTATSIVEENVTTDGSETSPAVTSVTIVTGTPIVTWEDSNVFGNINFTSNFEIVYEDKDGKPVKIITMNNPTNFMYEVTTNMPVGTYALKVRRIGNTETASHAIGFLTSDYSETELVYVKDISSVSISDGKASWINGNEHLTSAIAYRVKIFKGKNIDDNNKLLETLTTDKTLDFTTTVVNSTIDSESNGGIYTISVNAITDPSEGIISTYVPKPGEEQEETETTESINYATLFKPKPVENYKVIDGKLSWEIEVSAIQSFVETFVAPMDDSYTTANVIDYISSRINNPSATEVDETLESYISHLLKVTLVINGTSYVTYPTEVIKQTTGEAVTSLRYV